MRFTVSKPIIYSFDALSEDDERVRGGADERSMMIYVNLETNLTSPAESLKESKTQKKTIQPSSKNNVRPR